MGCGSVVRVVVSCAKGFWFKSIHSQISICCEVIKIREEKILVMVHQKSFTILMPILGTEFLLFCHFAFHHLLLSEK